nr:hypothetical protein [Tanacetum cinerariifolium]
MTITLLKIQLTKSTNVVRLQALIDRKKVIVTENSIRQALRLDDADSVDCLPNEDIFAEGGYTFDMLVPQQAQDVEDATKDEDAVNEVSVESTPHLPTLATPPPPPQPKHTSSPAQAETAKPSPLPQQQTSQTAEISMTLLNTLLETCATLTKQEDAPKELNPYIRMLLWRKLMLKFQRILMFRGEPVEEEEVIEVVIAAKLMTKVVTTAATTPITISPMPKANAPRRRRGVIIQDPEEAATALVILQSEVKSKDKSKGILVEKPNPLKRQAQIEQDEAFARELEAEINANINWNDVVDQVKRKERQDNNVMIYQALKRKPITETQARKNMMVYLKNMAEFKMDFFRGMTYIEIRHIFVKHFNLNQAFLERVEEDVLGQEEEVSKRKSESSKHRVAKKQRINEEVEELKTHLQFLLNDEDDVYTEATPLALKVPVIDYQIHHEHNKPFYKIIRADGTHQLFLSFITLLRNFNREN